MDPHLTEWTALLLRWFHLVTGAAWIGASFYFNWLNNHVLPVESGDPDPRVKGEVYAIHGGAFYRVSKYEGAPERLPRTLHWFKYEAYFTWITGFLLLGVTYWAESSAMMVDASVRALSPLTAVGLGFGSLVVGWMVYDLLCRSPLAERSIALAGVLSGLFAAAAFGLFQTLAPRAAAMHFGAMLGTIMAANVLFVIIPGQRAMVDTMLAGRPPPMEHGKAGALRSLHNNYLTLPVLFVMVSNHYPTVWGHPLGWALVVAIAAMGVLLRHSFNLRGVGHPKPWTPAILGSAGLILLAVVMRPAPTVSAGDAIPFTTAQIIIANRCLPCHSEVPTQAGVLAPPKGLVLEDRGAILANRARIGTQVESRAMPLGNLTGMTDEERTTLTSWAKASE